MVASTNTQAPTNLEVLWQEMEHQKRLTTDLASQVQRVRRFARVDELEAVTSKLEDKAALIRTMTTLGQAVQALVDDRRQDQSPDEAGQEYWHKMKAERSRQVARNLAHYRYMSTLIQTYTDRCPCGRHKGIRFTSKYGQIIEDNYCPQWWWIAMSRMSFESGKHKEFHKVCPLDKWLGKYVLKTLEKPLDNRASQP